MKKFVEVTSFDLLTVGQEVYVAKNAKKPKKNLIPAIIESLSLDKGSTNAIVFKKNKEYVASKHLQLIKEAIESGNEEALKKLPSPLIRSENVFKRTHVGARTKSGKYYSRRHVFILGTDNL